MRLMRWIGGESGSPERHGELPFYGVEVPATNVMADQSMVASSRPSATTRRLCRAPLVVLMNRCVTLARSRGTLSTVNCSRSVGAPPRPRPTWPAALPDPAANTLSPWWLRGTPDTRRAAKAKRSR